LAVAAALGELGRRGADASERLVNAARGVDGSAFDELAARGVVVALGLLERRGGPPLDLALTQRRVQHGGRPVEQGPHVREPLRGLCQVILERVDVAVEQAQELVRVGVVVERGARLEPLRGVRHDRPLRARGVAADADHDLSQGRPPLTNAPLEHGRLNATVRTHAAERAVGDHERPEAGSSVGGRDRRGTGADRGDGDSEEDLAPQSAHQVRDLDVVPRASATTSAALRNTPVDSSHTSSCIASIGAGSASSASASAMAP
jgi:hypothetical protein